MKLFIKEHFPEVANTLNRWYNHIYHLKFYNRTNSDIFTSIYSKNHWRNDESISGPGSSLMKTEPIRQSLPGLIEKYHITSILDIPCGDFNWMSSVSMENVHYTGMDIVKRIIHLNTTRYGAANRVFEVADITASDLPLADLIICRDCFVHLSYAQIFKATANIFKSKSAYLLATSFSQHTNVDIMTGNWRPINLSQKPFNWPAPIENLSEGETGVNSDKSLCLWKISDLLSVSAGSAR